METEDIRDKAEDLINHSGEYLETYYKLTLVKAAQKLSVAASSIVSTILIAGFFLFFLFFSCVALSLWMGDLMGSRIGGFLAIAAFFLLLLIIVVSIRKRVLSPYIKNKVIKNLYD